MHLILFDGVCGLCDRLVGFVIAHDGTRVFRFAALQSAVATEVLTKYGKRPRDLNTLYVVSDYGKPEERVFQKSDAALFVLRHLGGVWLALSGWNWVPRPIRDAAYDVIANTRYRVFGRLGACRVPSPEERALFLDGSAT